jgi:pSer/pThr/pTyr-binding forkhead associated (FHA) protein
VPESLLQILTFLLLLLVWLFLLRVIWAVWAEARAPLTLAPPTPGQQAAPRAAPRPAQAQPAQTAQPAQPASPAGAATRLKVVEPPERKGQAFDIADEVKIGRAATNHIALGDDSYVSQLHARLFRRDGSLYVEDLGSTNGTFLNRKQLTGPVALRRGDRIQVGRTVLEVSK